MIGPLLGMAIGAGLSWIGKKMGQNEDTTIRPEDPHLVAIKRGVYDNAFDLNKKSVDIFNKMNDATSKQLQDPAQYLSNLLNQYQQTAGETMGINNQKAQMRNQLMAQGIDPDSQEGMQQINMLSNQLYNQNQNNWLSNVGSTYTQGLQAQSDLMHTGQQAGFNAVSGIQADRAQQLAEFQEENKQIQQNIANNPLTKVGNTLMGAGTQATIYQNYPELYQMDMARANGGNQNPYMQSPAYNNPYQQQQQKMQQAKNLGLL